MLLQIIVDQRNVINGIKKIYELFGSTGDFSCEVIYRNPDDGRTRFFFFRDPGRPGRFIDAKSVLGQYFFCSTNIIWKDAIKGACDDEDKMSELDLNRLPVQIIPAYQIWEIDAQTLEITKHDVNPPEKREAKPKRIVVVKEKTSVKSDFIKIDNGEKASTYMNKYRYEFKNYCCGDFC